MIRNTSRRAPGAPRGAVHDFALVYLGVHLFDNCDLEALAQASRVSQAMGVPADCGAIADPRRNGIAAQPDRDVLTWRRREAQHSIACEPFAFRTQRRVKHRRGDIQFQGRQEGVRRLRRDQGTSLDRLSSRAKDVDRLLMRRQFFVTPYGRGRWVSLWADDALDWKAVADLVDRSYRVVALKRMIAARVARKA